MNTDVKRSLILAGGGMRVAYQAGVLLALEEAGIEFTHVDGTSGGIFNVAMLASGLKPKEIAQRWRTLKVKYFLSGRKFKDYFSPMFMNGYADADNIRNKVFPHLGIDILSIQHNDAINASFNVCNFSKKSVEAFGNREIQEDHLIAGVSLPIFMPALFIDSNWYTDAVWIKDANLMEAVNHQSQELWLVWAIGNSSAYQSGAFNQYVHMIEMSANGALLEEYRHIQMINNHLAAYGYTEPITLKVIKSEDPLPLDPDLFFNLINFRELINMGYENAKKLLKTGSVPDVPMDEEATRSSDLGNVLSFRGIFKGKLIWDAVETKVFYYTYFWFSEQDGKQKLSVYSSILIEALGEEIPVYDHQVSRSHLKGYTLVQINAKLLILNQEYFLRGSLKLYTPMETLLGMGYKKISLTLGKNAMGLENILLQGNLHQSISHRLKSSSYTKVRNTNGSNGGIKSRYDMISKLTTMKKPSYQFSPEEEELDTKVDKDSKSKNIEE
ncbi:MAG: patatin-like phospholipase family protein [Cyclobacteriaceae bacterium]